MQKVSSSQFETKIRSNKIHNISFLKFLPLYQSKIQYSGNPLSTINIPHDTCSIDTPFISFCETFIITFNLICDQNASFFTAMQFYSR